MFQFDFSYNSFVPRDDEAYASQDTVWKDIGVDVLNNAYGGAIVLLFAVVAHSASVASACIAYAPRSLCPVYGGWGKAH